MPSPAFLKAAKKGERRTVVLLAVESESAQRAALTTQDDWKAGTLTDLNADTEAGNVFLRTDGADPEAASTPDPGLIPVRIATPTTGFAPGDWLGGIVGQSKSYPLNLWSGWTSPTDPSASLVNLQLALHLFDGIASSLPVVVSSFSFEIWGKLNGGAPQRILADQKADESKMLQGVLLGPLSPGAWSFALHLVSKTCRVSSSSLGYSGVVPDTIYDNDGPSYLEIRALSIDYTVRISTDPTVFRVQDWYLGGPAQHSYPCDSWSDYTQATGPRAVEATLILRPHLFDGRALGMNGMPYVVTGSLTFEVWGRLDGGEPQRLLSDLIVTNSTLLQTVKLANLTRGSWQFALHITGKISMRQGLDFPTPSELYDNDGGSYLELYSFTTNQQVSYLPFGTMETAPLDLGEIPAGAPVFAAVAVTPPGCALGFAAFGSDAASGEDWTPLGAVTDGASLPPRRRYRFTVDFAASPDGLHSPLLQEISLSVGSFRYFSTLKDVPVPGAKPYLVEGSLNALSTSIQLMALGKVGEISPRLHLTREVSDLLATGYLKNKTVTCKIGFEGLAEQDYEPFFTGTWYDYSVDHEKMQVTIQTRDVWNQFKTQVPPGDNDGQSYWTDANGQKIAGRVYPLEGNIIDVILGVASVAGVPERFLDEAGFHALRDASFPDAQWTVKRELTSSQDADKLLADLAIAAGLFLYPAPDGRLSAVHWDTVLDSEPLAHLDALKVQFKPVQGGQKELYTRQKINYQLLPGKDGGSDSDFASEYLFVNQQAELDWQEIPCHVKSWNDVWALGYDPATGKVSDTGAIVKLAQRMDSWFATPKNTVQAVNLPPRYLGVKPGSVVTVDNLRLPAPAADWPGFVTAKKFLVLQKGINPNDLSLTLDLFELPGPTNYLPGELPSYQVWERFPAVVELSVAECVVQRATGGVDDLIILRFDRPADYVYGSAEIWLSVNGGPWSLFAPASFAVAGRAWIEVPCIVGYQYEFAVLTVNSAGLRQALENAPHIAWTATGVSTIPYLPPTQHDPDDGGGGDRDLPVVITPPNASNYPPVAGLSLTGQGNGTDFEGGSASFSWNRYSFTMELGAADGPAGAPQDSALKGYVATILNPDGSQRHSVLLGAVERYGYSYDLNYADGNGVPARQFSCQVQALGISGQASQPASLSVSNPAPPAIGEVTLASFIGAFTVSFQAPAAPDLAGYLVHGVPASGLSDGTFVPTANNLLYQGSATSALIDSFAGAKLAPGIWYLKVAAYDSFGPDLLNWSPLFSVEVQAAAAEILDLLTGQITKSQLNEELQESLENIVDVSQQAAQAVAAAADAIEAKTAAIAAQNAAEGSADAAQTSANLAATRSESAGQAADAANTSATAAASSAGAAGTSALAAQDAATSAETAATDAGTHAAAAATSAQSAASYSTAAEAAATSATSAKTSAEAASAAAGTSASAASTSSTQAAASAGAAATSASTATTQASKASTQAGYALAYAGQAATSSTDAQSAATSAATYASNAQGYAATAVSASSTASAAANSITAQYTIKVDANGKIAGIGLWSDGATSMVEILADRFAVVSSSNGASIVPFIVSDGVVYMNAAYVSGTLTATTLETAPATGNPRRVVIDSSDNSIKFFESGSATARVVIGTSTVGSGTQCYGVFGHSGSGNDKIGVYASSYSTTGVEGSSVQSAGVTGVSSLSNGVFGMSLTSQPSVLGSNSYGGPGVRGISSGGLGVHGVSVTYTAMYAESTSGIGLQANSGSSYGIVGANLNGNTYDIYAGGSGSNYGPFTGSHDALADEAFVGVSGDIVVDEEMLIKKGISSTLGVVRLSDTPKDKKVVGVVAVVCAANDPHIPAIVGQNQYALQLLEGTRCLIVNALGEGQINVCRDGGNIEAGDYLCSSARPGKGMRQADDVLHNYTVAKAREPATWGEGEDDIRQIACTYHCG